MIGLRELIQNNLKKGQRNRKFCRKKVNEVEGFCKKMVYIYNELID